MESTTLHFDNARAAAALYNSDEKLLREMESRFGVQVAARDGWIRIEGDKDKLERAARIFTQLDEARRTRSAALRHLPEEAKPINQKSSLVVPLLAHNAREG